MNDSSRRGFIKLSVASLATAGLGTPVFAQQQQSPAGIPTRPLGKTGERLPIVGLGGWHIGTAEEKEAISIMHEAIDQVKIAAEVCRRFALSLPISTLVCGIRSRKELRQDLAMARSFKPMTDEELNKLLEQTKVPGRDGKLEPFKTTRYGSIYHRKQHGER